MSDKEPQMDTDEHRWQWKEKEYKTTPCSRDWKPCYVLMEAKLNVPGWVFSNNIDAAVEELARLAEENKKLRKVMNCARKIQAAQSREELIAAEKLLDKALDGIDGKV